MAINAFFPCNYRYPFTNDHELNLGWVLATIKAQESELSKFVALNTVKYADPFEWNITTQYATNTVVFNPADMTAYISVQPVPSGVQIDNTDYWTPIFTLSDIFTAYKTSITPVEQIAAKPATQDISKGQLLWIDNVLYVAEKDISKGTVIVPGENVAETSVSAQLEKPLVLIAQETQAREAADTSLQQSFESEQSARLAADAALRKDIDDEQSARQIADAALQQDINELANRAVTGLNLSRVVFIGDSFVQGYGLPSPDTQNFAYQFCSALGITDFQIFGGGGIGFYHVSASLNVNALDYFKSIENQLKNPETVTTVFVCLGWNDRNENASNIQYGEKTFFQYIRPVFPKANIIYFANPGYSVIKKQALGALYTGAQSNGATCVDSHYWMLLDGTSFQSDYVHPNTAGHLRISVHLRNVIFGGKPFNYQILTGFNVDGFTATITAVNETVVVYLSGTKQSNERATRIATFPGEIFLGNANSRPQVPFRFMVPLGNDSTDFGFVQWDSGNNNVYCCSMGKLDSPSTFADGNFTANITFSAIMFFG